MGLTVEISAKVKARQTGSNDFGGPDFAPVAELLLQLTNGTAANQADLLYADERTISSASHDDIDLAGVLTSAFGAVITNAELVTLFVINKPRADGAAANTTNLTIGVGTNPFTGILGGTTPTLGPIRPGGAVLVTSPDAAGIGTVAAGTGDILRIANSSGASNTYQIVIIGRSA